MLREHFADRRKVLEIASGTGQHAVYFGAALPQLQWQTSDFAEHHDGIRGWIAASALDNVLPPITLDVRGAWPSDHYDAVFTANSLHIMDSTAVQALFAALPSIMSADAKLVIYGPFNYGGRFTSASNEAFDAMLRARGTGSGLRDFEWVDGLAAQARLKLLEDRPMPANNRCLIWQRQG